MGEQKNLFLAIIISIGIIVFFQFFFPTQPVQQPKLVNEEVFEPATSIDEQPTNKIQIVISNNTTIFTATVINNCIFVKIASNRI